MTRSRELAELASAYDSGGALGFRNRIINGNMVIDQRNAGASVTPANASYLVDRWVFNFTQASKFSFQQNAGSVTPPAGFTNYLGATVVSAVSVGAGDVFVLRQKVEGFNVADLDWGTAGAQPVTLSFWVRSSLTGTFGGAFQNSAENRAYPFTYTVSAANTWEQKTVTVAGDTTGTWLTTNGTGILLSFGLGVGTTSSGTAGSWAAANYASATGATSVVGTSGATFFLTGVQLEKGSVATPFEFRSIGQELALCQRYYEQQAARQYISYTSGGVSTLLCGQWSTTKRATPTTSVSSAIASLLYINNSTAIGAVAWSMGITGAGADGATHAGTIIGSAEL